MTVVYVHPHLRPPDDVSTRVAHITHIAQAILKAIHNALLVDDLNVQSDSIRAKIFL